MAVCIRSFLCCICLLSVFQYDKILAAEEKFADPIIRVVDLDVGETESVTLSNGENVVIKLVKLDEARDPIRQAVRKATVEVEIDGKAISLQSGMYNLPQSIGAVQVDCSVTSGLNSNGTATFWGLDKAARIRVWPASSPLLKPGSFIYPVKQRWFVTNTWYDHEPVDGGKEILPKIYYHSGLDIGGTEHLTEVIAATDAIVVSSGVNVLDGYSGGSYADGSPIAQRADVVYLLDERGWYYRYSHLAKIEENIVPGRHIDQGTRIGNVGKEGASGGWSHLHFEIKSRQPSGKWGTQAGYAFLREAYISQYEPEILANARPGHFIRAGETATLNGLYSWSKHGPIKSYEWLLEDGSVATEAIVEHRYTKPGVFHEMLKVTDQSGNIDYDFTVVKVVDPKQPDQYPPNIHATYWPSLGVKSGDEITFKVRGFNYAEDDNSPEIWDFGDGSELVEVHSVGGRKNPHAKDGYAVTTHRYQNPGHYVVTVQRKSQTGLLAVARLQVRIGSSR